jgi:hypothetical protein
MEAETPTICATSLMRKYPCDGSPFVERFRVFPNQFPLDNLRAFF